MRSYQTIMFADRVARRPDLTRASAILQPVAYNFFTREEEPSMRQRWPVYRWALMTGIAGLSLVAAPVSGQTQASKPAVNTTKAWTAHRTPWGDPAIEGVWTSDSVRGIPLQRPVELAGKAELSEEEFAKKVERDQQTRKQAEDAEGAFRN